MGKLKSTSYVQYTKTLIPNFKNDQSAEKMRILQQKIRQLETEFKKEKKIEFKLKIILILFTQTFGGTKEVKKIEQLVNVLIENNFILDYEDQAITMSFITSILHDCLDSQIRQKTIKPKNVSLSDLTIDETLFEWIKQMKIGRDTRHIERAKKLLEKTFDADNVELKEYGQNPKIPMVLDPTKGIQFTGSDEIGKPDKNPVQLVGGRKRTRKRKKKR